jgi:hypothetical protein
MEQVDALLETTPLVSEEKEETVVPDSPKKELKPLPENLKYKFSDYSFKLIRCSRGGIVRSFERA